MGNIIPKSYNNDNNKEEDDAMLIENVKHCFKHTLVNEITTQGCLQKIKQMSHAQLTQHLRDVLNKTCLIPNGIDINRDPWWETRLQLVSCTVGYMILARCYKTSSLETCTRNAQLKCCSQSSSLSSATIKVNQNKKKKKKSNKKNINKKKPTSISSSKQKKSK